MSRRLRRYLVQASVGIIIAIGLAWAFLRPADKNRGLTNLDVWQREITHLDDDLREGASEGPDTDSRDDDDND